MHTQPRDPCPRCHAEPLRAWQELTDDERELVRRLPASADHTLDQRIARRRWCTRCWHEESGGGSRDA